MKRISQTFALLSLLSLPVVATAEPAEGVNFSGRWAGTGTLTEKSNFTGNRTSQCRSIEVTIVHLTASISAQHYRGICGYLDSEWGPDTFEIQGTKLFQEGEEVGSINGNIMLSTAAQGGVQYALNFRLNPPTSTEKRPTLDTYYGTRSLVGAMVIEGRLLPVE